MPSRLSQTNPLTLAFTKMHGLGNDFMMVNILSQSVHLTGQQIAQLANRHTGIGFDQCIIIEQSLSPNIDFNYRIYNADGHEVEQCGNGVRCVAAFIWQKHLSNKPSLILATPFDCVTVHQTQQAGQVSVEFAAPRAVSFDVELAIDDEIYRVDVVQLANPHAILKVDMLETAPVAQLGQRIAHHPYFKAGTNVEFVQQYSPQLLQMRVFERGVEAETQACGTGAMAVMVAYRLRELCDQSVTLRLPGGDLLCHWPGGKSLITMTGPACMVYDGFVDLQWIIQQ